MAKDAPTISPVTKSKIAMKRQSIKESKTSNFSQNSYVASQITQTTADEGLLPAAGGPSWQTAFMPAPRERRKTQRAGFVDSEVAIDAEFGSGDRSPVRKAPPPKPRFKPRGQDEIRSEAQDELSAAKTTIAGRITEPIV